MRVEDVYISSVGVHLPDWVSVDDAEGIGDYQRGEFKAAGLTGTYLAGDTPAVDMAVSAARSAIERSSANTADIDSHIHGSVYYQVPEGAYAPGYILRELGTGNINSFDIQQGCNGMLGALEVAIGQLTGAAKMQNVLLTTASNFTTPLFNRWMDFGTNSVYSDGAAAAVVNSAGGFAKVRSMNSGTLHELEKWHRGEESLLPPRGESSKHFNMGERSQHFIDNEMPLPQLFESFFKFDLGVINDSLVDAGMTAEDITKVITINVDSRMIDQALMRPLGIPADRLCAEFGKSVGHSGGADIFITLDHLARTGQLQPGDNVLMTSQGPGWICSSCILTITEVPSWGEPK
ncbi:ketoacyl-ACP synthase III family protein [Streptomyces sp. ISL-11]|uniref:ketoacyl-ACP synthase III family protein n=1 Tax=Streptomyces sp. ISL-11 TaxID=2819174 RepID=UPI001BE6F06E|nr:ketoacyl-ACP synthase III family protein [Streptomyces sp. ISL-11]MBT2383222.1 ketoacyl-ACP synthase III family protein [Streptomyces sp. ISL-11]